MSIVTQLPYVSAQSRAFISGRSKVHGMVTYIHKWGGDGGKRCGNLWEIRYNCKRILLYVVLSIFNCILSPTSSQSLIILILLCLHIYHPKPS